MGVTMPQSNDETLHEAASTRKRALRALFDQHAPERERWIGRNRYFYGEDERYMRFLVPKGSRVRANGQGQRQWRATMW